MHLRRRAWRRGIALGGGHDDALARVRSGMHLARASLAGLVAIIVLGAACGQATPGEPDASPAPPNIAALTQYFREQSFTFTQGFADCAHDAGWDFVKGPDVAALTNAAVPIQATVPGDITLDSLRELLHRCYAGEDRPQMVVALDGPTPAWLAEFQRIRTQTGYRIMLTWNT